MKFGLVATGAALGQVLAHSAGGLKKGLRLTAEDLAQLAARGIQEVTTAALDASDMPEDEAARSLSNAIAGEGCDVQAPFTGRANLHAAMAGILVVDEARVDAFNAIHESLTLATLRDGSRVYARQMLATVKIIPFAAPRVAVKEALDALQAGPVLCVAPFQPQRVGMVITTTAEQKASLVEKSRKAIADRLAALGSELVSVETCAHDAAAVGAAIVRLQQQALSMILLFGAAAIVDRADVVPAGLERAGGEVLHLGMPVDPGNLLMLGRLEGVPVVGVPTCARSPKENGFDWVLQRLCAGIVVSPRDIMAMGAGGLLAEIASRPAPREGSKGISSRPRIAAIVLAAGMSSRMAAQGLGNKLLAELHGKPLVRRTVDRVLDSGVDRVFVVTGHQAAEVSGALDGLQVQIVHNAAYPTGLASSLRAGLAAAQDFDAVFMCLGDMPLVAPDDMRRMMAAFNIEEGRSIVAPTQGRKLGNPVLWGREHYDALMQLEGDRGARGLLEVLRESITEVAAADEGVLLDADTPEALRQIRGSAPA